MDNVEKALEYLSDAIKEADDVALVIEKIMDRDGDVDLDMLKKAKSIILSNRINTGIWNLYNEFGRSGIPISENSPELVANSVSEIYEILYDIVDLFNGGIQFYDRDHEENYLFGLKELTKMVEKFERDFVDIGDDICSVEKVQSMFYSYPSILALIYGQVEALFFNSNPSFRRNNYSIYDISEQDEIDGGYRDGKWTR